MQDYHDIPLVGPACTDVDKFAAARLAVHFHGPMLAVALMANLVILVSYRPIPVDQE